MCFNCGCQMADDDMGNPKNITTKTFDDAANAEDQTKEEAMRSTLELLKKILKEEE